MSTPAHRSPAYRRALWIVVVLNIAWGIIEMAGGFLAGSQALKADALDFIGDGLITFIGLLAIAWSAVWRARPLERSSPRRLPGSRLSARTRP